ncbi:phytanoyl-CoA dioxygenase family protein [Knoellia sp. S7-12]|uniref:phytanoyl-CoA dioxygenase family protein n=1 Tax=Knoellia sp. S7-12 TaxID=3126698 RepID=UPI0033696CBE
MAATNTQPRHWLRPEDCHLEDLLGILAEGTHLADYPHADRDEQGVVAFTAERLRAAVAAGEGAEVSEELCRAWTVGPGIVVITGAFEAAALDPVTTAFQQIVADEKAAGGARGDHFGKPGANDRIWNALEKLAVAAPEAFVDYYANDMVALGAGAWLGPGYQVTAQPNIVLPGGVGQTVHRDYHLGFMNAEQAARYPAHVHAFSPELTLQGAVAHLDMPVESGPTLYLPHSQKYALGYLAYWLPEFQDYFVANHVQLPLTKGDLVWFNPALFHAAGSNVSTDIQRMANLLQVSSAFGRAMDSVDRARVVEAIYPILRQRVTDGWDGDAVENVIAASAEGYSFPVNLDRAQPVDGMAPPTQADLVRAALAEGASEEELTTRLRAHVETTLSH